MKSLIKTAALAAILFNFCSGTKAQTTNGLHLKHTSKVWSNGGWDYLTTDHAHNKLYVSHGTQVNVLRESTGDSVGVIANTPGVHGIALIASLNKGYTSNGKANECTVFNMNTLEVITKVKVGENPDAIFYDDFSKNIFVFNGHGQSVSVIDPQKDLVIGTLALGGKPETGVSDGKGHIYVNIEDKNELVCFSAKSLKVLKRYKLDKGEEPSGLAIDRANSRLFVGCANKVMLVLDAVSGKTIASLPIGDGCDGVVFDPALGLAYSANGEGTISVVKELNANHYELLETVKTALGARTLALDNETHHIFLPTADLQPGSGEGKKHTFIPGTFRVMEFGH